jgi:hypothetical protein
VDSCRKINPDHSRSFYYGDVSGHVRLGDQFLLCMNRDALPGSPQKKLQASTVPFMPNASRRDRLRSLRSQAGKRSGASMSTYAASL